MAYKWLGMKKIPWEDVKSLHEKGDLIGFFLLYDDYTESYIDSNYEWEDIVKHHECGGEFGVELPRVDLTLADGKRITAPEVVDISAMGCLDELEYDLWNVIQNSCMLFGINMEDDSPDFATVKAVQDKILEELTAAGVRFHYLQDN